MNERFFRYVLHERIADYLQLGWMLCAPLGPPHDEYAVLMCWLCNCGCVEPKRYGERA